MSENTHPHLVDRIIVRYLRMRGAFGATVRFLGPILFGSVLLGALAVTASTCVGGCTASAARKQAIALDGYARLMNVARPVMFEVYEHGGQEVIETSCGHTRPCANPDQAAEDLAAYEAKWTPVWVTWEAFRMLHDEYATKVEECQANGDACAVDYSLLQARVAVRFNELRCVLVSVGVPTLGPCEAPPPTPIDGGL